MLMRAMKAIRGDAMWLLTGRVAQLGNGFLLSIVLVRQFGLASAGTYAIAALAIMAASLLCTLGQISSLPRSGLTVRESSFVTLASTLLTAPPALLGIAALGLLMGHSPTEFWEILTFGIGGIFLAQMSISNMLLIMRGSAFLTIVAPLVGTIGILAGGFFSNSVLEFAVYVTVSRLIGNVIVYAVMGIERVPLGRVFAEMRRGGSYLATDALLTANDQIVTILLALILSREDMGVWGICRQLSTAADTPSWSIVQAKYPEMIRSPHETWPSLTANIALISIAVALTGAIASFGLGHYVYHVEALGPLMAVLLFGIPARYIQNLDDQLMRAIGAGSMSARLAALRMPVTVIMTPAAAYCWGIWGAATSVTAAALVLVAVYRLAARSRLAEVPAPPFGTLQETRAPA